MFFKEIINGKLPFLCSGTFIVAVTEDYEIKFNFKISLTVTHSAPTEERQ